MLNPKFSMKPLFSLSRWLTGGFTVALTFGWLAIDTVRAAYPDIVLADKPVAYWRLNDKDGQSVRNLATDPSAAQLNGEVKGKVKFQASRQQPDSFPDFEPDGSAAAFGAKGDFIRIKDPGENSPLDFAKGDSLTLEAWVSANKIGEGQQVYVVGKGRTQNQGFAKDNQNYALRLRGEGGMAHVSFLFRDERNRAGTEEDWHRWTSNVGFAPGSGWHYIAITYTFGKGASIKGYIDGEAVSGAWDMGGKTDLGPVVDNDDIWIGSSMGGSSSSTFNGLIDEVAIYRTALTAEQAQKRCRFIAHVVQFKASDLPVDKVRVEVVEGVPTTSTWNFVPPAPNDSYLEDAFALVGVPTKYSNKGIKVDRTNPFMLRASSVVEIPAGEYHLLLRARTGARLIMDGKVLMMTKFMRAGASGHEDVPEVHQAPGLRYLRPGHDEQTTVIKSSGGKHVFTLEAYVGGKKLRPETGDLSVGIAGKDEKFYVLSPKLKVPLTEEGWTDYASRRLAELQAQDVTRRQVAGAAEAKYWAMRHDEARKLAAQKPAVSVPTVKEPAANNVDRFILARLETAKITPGPLLDDLSFLRRVTLDTVGVLPSQEEISAFQKDQSADRRAKVIDRLLNDSRWADHWVSYWQDVLAENPGILKPTLNNSGPFRYWIHESLVDNKPMDRFATELIMMEGSLLFGGPAGFSMASQNDVPMAAKAQVIGEAFLAMELKCARCHDAPYHRFKQKDLFSLSAMLKKETETVPITSSIPTNANIRVGRLVEVTLLPGSKVEPTWPFPEVMSGDFATGVLREANDPRERLAALITDARNERFAKVIVNRLWKNYLGLGMVEPVEDWENSKPSHPELLNYLAREFVTHDYDLKYITRLILNSYTYQRTVTPQVAADDKPENRYFASPVRRRLEAEQLVDSLFAAVGKPIDSEELNMDVDGRENPADMLNLGTPVHAWEFVSLSNERDRPALSMPKAQSVLDVLAMFGWRESRPNPLSTRDEAPNVLQPATLANGILGSGRIARLSDDSYITDLCLENQALPDLIRTVFLRVLTRPPTEDEMKLFVDHLQSGYDERVVKGAKVNLKHSSDALNAVSWSNHLSPEASKIKLEMERIAREGDLPTQRLRPEWRERMEDSLWALVNSPEFMFVP